MELLNGPHAADCRNELRLDWHLCRGSFRQILPCAFGLSVDERLIAQEADKVLQTEFKNVGSQPTQNKGRDMNPTLAAKGLIRKAYPLGRYGKLENIVHHVVRFISPRVTKDFTPRRARAIWEGAARRIDSDEMDALREALFEEQKREQKELRARLAALDEILADFGSSASGS
jgi:hypothetical protein